MNIPISVTDFDPFIAFALFIAYIVVDGIYAYYTLQVADRNAIAAASSGALMHFLLAAGVLGYTENVLYLLPLAAGSWVGTYLVVKRSSRRN